MLTAVDSDIIKIISEACFNTLRGNMSISQSQFKRLKKYKQTIRTLARKNVALREKRGILVRQSGGFLPLLLPILASSVGGLLSQVWNK